MSISVDKGSTASKDPPNVANGKVNGGVGSKNSNDKDNGAAGSHHRKAFPNDPGKRYELTASCNDCGRLFTALNIKGMSPMHVSHACRDKVTTRKLIGKLYTLKNCKNPMGHGGKPCLELVSWVEAPTTNRCTMNLQDLKRKLKHGKKRHKIPPFDYHNHNALDDTSNQQLVSTMKVSDTSDENGGSECEDVDMDQPLKKKAKTLLDDKITEVQIFQRQAVSVESPSVGKPFPFIPSKPPGDGKPSTSISIAQVVKANRAKVLDKKNVDAVTTVPVDDNDDDEGVVTPPSEKYNPAEDEMNWMDFETVVQKSKNGISRLQGKPKNNKTKALSKGGMQSNDRLTDSDATDTEDENGYPRGHALFNLQRESNDQVKSLPPLEALQNTNISYPPKNKNKSTSNNSTVPDGDMKDSNNEPQMCVDWSIEWESLNKALHLDSTDDDNGAELWCINLKKAIVSQMVFGCTHFLWSDTNVNGSLKQECEQLLKFICWDQWAAAWEKINEICQHRSLLVNPFKSMVFHWVNLMKILIAYMTHGQMQAAALFKTYDDVYGSSCPLKSIKNNLNILIFKLNELYVSTSGKSKKKAYTV